MKVYITGTTSGLGKALLEFFPDAFSLNKPHFDLAKDISPFIKDDFDIYINNAHYAFAQTRLLYALFEKNKHRNCHIISIGSVSSDGDRKTINQYAVEKTALEKASSQLSLIESHCKVSLIKPGRMKTKMVKHIKGVKKMKASEVASLVNFVASQPRHLNVKNITLDSH